MSSGDQATRPTSISLAVTHLLILASIISFHSYPSSCYASKSCDKPCYLGISSSRTQNPLPGPREESPRDYNIHGREPRLRGHVSITCLLSKLKELIPLAVRANTKQSSKSGNTPKTLSPVNGNMSTTRSKSARPTERNQMSTTMVFLSPRKSSRRN